MSATEKHPWHGQLIGIQARIRLTRSFDERSHTYLGYALRLEGTIASQRGKFLVGLGLAAHDQHRLGAGDWVDADATAHRADDE